MLAALLCACALGCNTFDDPGDPDGDLEPPTTTNSVPPRGTLPPIMTSAGPGVSTTPPGADVMAPSVGGMATVPCVPCGTSCMNCGGGCFCEPGGTPDKDEWLSPFRDNGDDGWKDSTSPFCSGLGSVWGTDIERDGGTVYVMVHGTDDSPGGIAIPDADGGTVSEMRPPFSAAQRTRVLQNDGTGWTLRAELVGMGAGQQLGRVGSSLLIYGNVWQGRDEACSLGTLMGDRFRCEDLGNVQDVHTVSDSSAFALANGTDVFAFDGSAWRQLPDTLNNLATSIWADEREIVVGAGGGKIGRRAVGGDTWSFVDAGVETAVTALWGTSDDLWAGDLLAHLLHFDGTSWSTVADLGKGSSCSKRAPILGIVGAGSNVWAYTESQLARWDGEKLETFGNWTCAAMESASGERIDRVVSAGGDGLFIAISNTLAMRPCGASFLVHYDGKQFHRF